MKYNWSLMIILAVFLGSCGNADEESKSETVPATTLSEPGTNTASVAPGTVQNTMPATVNTPVVTNKAGLNPEHGQPGHRCEIAVGAPLDSKPVTPTITQTSSPATSSKSLTPAPVVNTNTVSPTTTKTKAGLNPAHGQPGHRCDIPEGTPLDTKPSKPTATISQPTTTISQPATTISQPKAQKALEFNPTTNSTSTSTSATVTPAGMNPEHGKPGHRCEIAVGAPLNSKPKQ